MAIRENDYALTDLPRVKLHAGITTANHDAELDRLINEVSTRIEGFLGRHLLSREWVHDGTTLPRLDSHGGTRLYLPEYPVTAVSSLKLYPTHAALTAGYASHYVVDNSAGIVRLVGGGTFFDQPQVVEITYTAGYADGLTGGQQWVWGVDEASAELRLAATIQTVWQWHQKQREREGVASRSEAGTTVTYLSAAWLPEVAEILGRHKRSYL
jgi:hypothetical protein